MSAIKGARKGIYLGLANVFAIALGVAISERAAGLLLMVVVFAAVPGVVLGLVLGLFAGAYPKWPPLVRLVLLVLPCVALVATLADDFRMTQYITVAMIPTVIATSMLERWTRWREPQPLPVAHAVTA